jgi:RNA polymerase sigma factor (sigma-70 family)
VSQPVASLRLGPVSDERLVSKLRAGDSRAFEAIYDRYERPIRSFCRHMLGQPEDADDAAQHTFLAAYRELVGSDKQIDLRPWLFTVARNRCRTLLRARYRGMAFSEPMEYEPSVEGLAVEVERREHLRDLMRDIARLPEDQRAALLLTQLETLRHDEVARVLDVPAEKVKALVFQARSSLVASELARETPCLEIREQLATLSGAGLRRRMLRRHVRDCAGCREFELKLRRQRHAILVLLPVASSPIVRDAVAAHLAGSAAAGGGAAGGLTAGSGAAAGGGLSSLVGNAVVVKTATMLSVAAAGAGAVAVTVGVRAVGPMHSHSSSGQSPTSGVAVGDDPPATSRQVALRTWTPPATPLGERSHSASPVRSREQSPQQSQADTHAGPGPTAAPDAQSPGATVPVKDNPGAGDDPPGTGKTKDKKPDTKAPANPDTPPGQAEDSEPNPQGQGQGEGQDGQGQDGQGQGQDEAGASG